MSKDSKNAKNAKQDTQKNAKDRAPVKVPDGRIGRAVFAGTKVAAAFTAVRTIRDARAKGDRLALLHGALTAAGLVVTVALASRALREAAQDRAADAAGDGTPGASVVALPEAAAPGISPRSGRTPRSARR